MSAWRGRFALLKRSAGFVSRTSMRRARVAALCAFSIACAGVLAPLREAQACGGCFAPPGAIQTVNAHRMVLSLSSTQTTLWDQFSYTGRAADFSWILPVQNGPSVRVRVADDRFMTLLDNLTAPVLTAPSRPYCFDPCFMGGWADASVSADASGDSGVTVYREEVVGPYAVAVLGGSDPMAIRNWLRDNGFTVPTAVSPVIDYYTGMRSDYIAIKLRPGEGINRMVPVRVTMNGYQPSLPLRMIAAGIADKVALQLTVFAASRIEAANFPNAEIRERDLVYDFDRPTVPSQDFLQAFNTVNRANGGRVWLAETVDQLDAATLESQASTFISAIMPRDGGSCGDDGGAGDGGCDEPNAVEDVRTAFTGIGTTATVSRLRADLAGTMLDRDLMLQASTGPMRSRFYSYGTVRNMPDCPPRDGGCGPGFDAGPPELDAGPSVRDAGALLDARGGDARAAEAGGPDVMAGGGGCSVDAAPGSVRNTAGLAGLAAVAAIFARRRGRSRQG